MAPIAAFPAVLSPYDTFVVDVSVSDDEFAELVEAEAPAPVATPVAVPLGPEVGCGTGKGLTLEPFASAAPNGFSTSLSPPLASLQLHSKAACLSCWRIGAETSSVCRGSPVVSAAHIHFPLGVEKLVEPEGQAWQLTPCLR
jgi:hypothetical protein